MKVQRLFAAALLMSCATWGAIASAQITFMDISRQAGIQFVHNNGARGKKYLPETMGPGCAFIDYDNDGFPDILLVNGKDLEAPFRHSTLKLYHNNGNGTFADVTAKSGLAIEMFGLGVAVGDFDNDGFDDIFITALGQSHLYRNSGKGSFVDVTKPAGLFGPNEFSTSAAWVDYDRDGKLDLIVGNYVQWSQKTDIYCTLDGTKKSYCTPEAYKGASVRLWHNLGNGHFEDATAKAGLFDATSKSLGIAISDVNGDGWSDLIIANDTQPNKLYINDGKGKFNEAAVGAGIAFSEDGVARAGMGVDSVDYDRSGKPSIIIGNFSNQMMALYHNEGNALFVDEAPRSEVGRKSLLTLGFACFFFDYDLDGWQDIFVNNGHIENEIERIQKRVKYAQPAPLFHNDGRGQFSDATPKVGPAFAAPRVGRGSAYADIDNDGDLDLLITTNGGPAILLRNDGATNHSLRVKLSGVRSNRDGIGAVVTVKSGSDQQSLTMRSGSSYLSASELTLTFGLGNKTQADELTVTWPSGQVERLKGVPAGQTITVHEGTGITNRRAYKPRT
jgi:enediyne biosynthesis protein E4